MLLRNILENGILKIQRVCGSARVASTLLRVPYYKSYFSSVLVCFSVSVSFTDFVRIPL